MMIRKQKTARGWVVVGLGLLAMGLLVVLPLVIHPNSTFMGTDNAGAAAIQQIAPQYDSSWATNWWRPGAETESMLFAAQAAVGGLLIGYAFGFLHGRKSAPATQAGGESAEQ